MSDQDTPPPPPLLGAETTPADNLPPPPPLLGSPMSASYRMAANNNPEQVADSIDIAKRHGIDPNYVLNNLSVVQKADAMPDFDEMKKVNPATWGAIDANKDFLGIAHDEIPKFIQLDNHAKTAKIASTMLQAAQAGWQGSVRGKELRMGMPDVVVGPDAPLSYDAISQGIGMALDLPEFAVGEALGGLAGPTAGTVTAFGLHSAINQALTDQYTKGSVDPKAAGLAFAKGGVTGAGMSLFGAGALAYGAGSATKLAFQVAGMTATSAAVEGRYPTTKDALSNSITFLGAEAASMAWEKMGDVVTSMKTRGRGDVGAKTVSDFADSVHGPAYVPVDKWDSLHGDEVGDINKKLGIEQAYAAAKASGGDVEIPAGKYLSKDMDAHRGALHDDVKSDPEAKTVNQLKDQEKQRADEAKAQEDAAKDPDKSGSIPAPDPSAVNVRVIHHGETAIDSSGPLTPEEKARGILEEPQTHGPKFSNLPLTDDGRSQVEDVADKLRSQGVSRITSGDSARTEETGGIIAPTTADNRFDGMKFPQDYSGMPVKEFTPILKEHLAAWAKDPDSKSGDGESFNDFQNRNIAALRDATANAKPGENIGLALSSDSVQLFKLIAENGGKPLSGDIIKRMAEKESINPASVDSYKVNPASGLLQKSSEPIKSYPLPQNEIPEFRKWFEGSKVVDEKGNPVVVYHGTNQPISKFSAESASAGHFFVDRPDVAAGYSNYAALNAPVKEALNEADRLEKIAQKTGDNADWDKQEAAVKKAERLESELNENRARGQNIYPAYLSIKNPATFDAKGESFVSISEELNEFLKNSKAEGKDGAIIKNLDDDPGFSDRIGTHYVAFSADQIKSSISGFDQPGTPIEQRERATSQAISEAQQETGQAATPIKGLDPKTQAELGKMQESARKEAEKILLKPQYEELKAKNIALIKAERERAGNEIRGQLNNDPALKAWSMFKTSKENIWSQSADYIKGDLSDEKSLKFEAIAEFSGFSSADEMARKLVTTDPAIDVEPAVKARLEQHMAQFANLKDTDAIKAEALKAVHNEQSGQLLALQKQVLEGMGHNAEINAEQAKARRADADETWNLAKMLARDTIRAKPAETAGRFRPYYTAERDAAVRVEKAQADGDFTEAAKAKNEQLTNHALAAESLRVGDDIERNRRSIEKQQKADKTTWKDQEHFFQSAAIMKRFGFERDDYDPNMKQESLSDYADRMSEKAGEDAVNIPDWLKDESVSKDWRKLTPDQLQDVRDTLKNIKHLANTEDNMSTLGKGMERQAFVNDLVEEANKNVRGGHTPGADPRADFGEKMWNLTERWGNVSYAVETILSKLDGWKLGGKWGSLITEKSRAQDNEAARKAEDAAWWNETNKAYTPKELADLDGKKIFIPEIKDSLSKRAMMIAIANTGTESNERVLKEGRGWSDDQIEAIKGKMEKRDFDVMQALLDRHEDNNKPALAEMARRRAGFEPKWIEAKPIKTPFGEYRGGYIPLVRDNRVSSRGMEESSLDEAPQTFKAATYQGFNKERNSHAQYPVSLDINDQLRALNRVSHYLTMQDWVSDMNSLMNSNDIKSTIIDTSGKDRLNTINNLVKDVAGNGGKEKGSLDGIVRNLTDRTVISQLGTKMSVTIAAGTHGIFAVGGVDPENFGPIKVYGGLLNFLGGMVKDPINHFSDAKQFMLENSKYMAQHANESEGSIEEAADRMAGKNRFGNAVRDFAFSAMHGLYNLTITPIWNDAYKTGLTIKDGDHDAAVDYANMIVRGSSPPGRTSDIPTIMHDSTVGKLLFLMHGFADRQYQMMVRAGGRYGVQVREAGSAADVAKATSQFLGTYANVLVIPGMAMAGLKMIGSGDDERSHKIFEKHTVRALSPLTTYPVISAMQDMALDASFGVRGNTSLSSVGSMFDTYQQFVNETTSDRSETEQKIEGAARVASFAGPYPQAVNDAAFNMADIIFNGMQPRASDLIRRRPFRERGE